MAILNLHQNEKKTQPLVATALNNISFIVSCNNENKLKVTLQIPLAKGTFN